MTVRYLARSRFSEIRVSSRGVDGLGSIFGGKQRNAGRKYGREDPSYASDERVERHSGCGFQPMTCSHTLVGLDLLREHIRLDAVPVLVDSTSSETLVI